MQGQQPRRTFSRATLRRIVGLRPAAPPGPGHLPAAQRRVRPAGGGHARAGRPGGRRDRRGTQRGPDHRAGRADRRHRPGGRGGGHRRALAVGPHRRGPHPRPAPGGVRPRAAHAGRLLHPHPHRRAGQPAQQRRHRRPAGLHLDPVGRGQQPHHPLPHAGGDAAAVVADHRAGADPAARVRAARPAHGRPPGPPRTGGGRPQRGHDHPDDRAVLGPRRHAWSSCSAARPGRRPSSAIGPSGWPRSACARPWASTCSSLRWRWSRRWRSPWSTGWAAGWRCRAGSTPAPW